jgi:hypothetical protein
MKVKNLNLLLTYKCPSRCRHCAYFSGLEGTGLMSTQEVKTYLNQLSDQPLESLWIYGGEPFLYIGVLTEVVKIARRRHLRTIGVLTNGYWATKPATGLKKLLQLRQAGLNAIVISTDGFHCEAIPAQLAMDAARAALAAGFKKVTASVSFIPPRKASNPFNDRSAEIWDQFSQIPGLSVEENPVTVIGRAGEELLDYCQLQQIRPPSSCRPPSYIDGSFKQPLGLEIDPHGWIMLCPGLSLGNAQVKPLAAIIAQYDDSANSLWRIFRREGPAGLVRLAEEKGYVRRELYASVCHLCYEARKSLLPHYPGQLAPATCYTELRRKGPRLR